MSNQLRCYILGSIILVCSFVVFVLIQMYSEPDEPPQEVKNTLALQKTIVGKIALPPNTMLFRSYVIARRKERIQSGFDYQSSLSIEAIKQYYLNEMSLLGWKVVRDNKNSNSIYVADLVFEKDHQVLSIYLNGLDNPDISYRIMISWPASYFN